MSVKTCTKCLESKSLAEYHSDATSPDGKTYQCKACRNARARKANPLRKEYRKAFTAKKQAEGYCVNCLSRKAEQSQRLCDYCYEMGRTASLNNKAARRQSGQCMDCSNPASLSRTRCESCLSLAVIRGRKWERENAERVNLRCRVRYAQQRENGGSFSADEWTALCAEFDNLCVDCQKPEPLAADHVIPVFYGGTSDISNIQPLCIRCNSRKGFRVIVDYRLPWKRVESQVEV